MRLAVPFVAALLTAGCALIQAPDRATAFPWGASPDAVRAARHDEPIVATARRQVYHAVWADMEATLVYHFEDAALTEVVVINRSGHSDRTRYIEDFERLSDRLRERHGQPEYEEMRWRNRLFADRPERWGDAISAGHLVYLARWDAPDADVLMALRGERYQVVHELVLHPPSD